MARRTNRPWTEEDDRRLIELKAAGRTAVSISAALKRSSGAVTARLSVLRVRQRASSKEDQAEGAVAPEIHYSRLQGKLYDD